MVYNKKEVKEIIWKKWLFPDFSNKLTWFIGGTGAAIILTPTPFKHLFYNWLVDTFNLNSGIPYTLSDLQNSTADYSLGFGLIFLALLHNIGYRVLIYKTEQLSQNKKQAQIDVDEKLFIEFAALLPADGLDVCTLKDHDFGNAYHRGSFDALEKFVNTWDHAQKSFLDKELESKRNNFLGKAKHFIHTLAVRSYPIGNGDVFSCIPDRYRGSYDWPDNVSEQISELNDLATELFELHREFILSTRLRLVC
ncbi:hypothetical protein PMAN_a2540 [Pseudoalteromonas marina]|jgi:hypothetical protein|uniref:hypothetical protein n=1 Tax=Pseudoalteromonas TaxID=53246 RepID=UPI00026CFCED|nr:MULTISPECIES: hypothetical protein [Pseudoalteromonas]KAF7777288.1 hypothetical protein PMAN_a2540 [Pseudoalteromonas marina]